MEHSKIYSDYCSHHGIKDQKWGVRRFQNYDGTLTPAGKKRYYGDSGNDSSPSRDELKKQMADYISYHKTKEAYDKVKKEEAGPTTSESLQKLSSSLNQTSNTAGILGKYSDAKHNAKAQAAAREAVKNMSNQDILNIVNRMELESRYVRNVAPESHKNEQRVRDILSTAGTLIGIVGGTMMIIEKTKAMKKSK